MKKIDLMIVGAQKAGSTSLKNYLNEHPFIISHPQLEFTYFVNDSEYQTCIYSVWKKYFGSQDWANKYLLGKNVTLSFRENGLKKLKHHNPACKIIFLLRNPVERAFSSYQMAIKNGTTNLPLEKIIDIDKMVTTNKKLHFLKRFILELGIYNEQLSTIRRFFPGDQIKLILFEDLKFAPEKVCKEIFEFIGVDSKFKPNTDVIHNQGGKVKNRFLQSILIKLRKNEIFKQIIKLAISERYFVQIAYYIESLNLRKPNRKPRVNPDITRFLISYYLPYNKKLERMTGLDLSKWNE